MNIQAKNKKWTQSILRLGEDMHSAIKNLNNSGTQIVLITDKTNILVGTISDGDIRRGLMNGLDLNSSVEKVMRLDPFVVNESITKDAATQLMMANNIRQIPIVDNSKKVIGMHLLQESAHIYAQDNLMVIMAGGKGTRLKPYTEDCPKPMLKIDGRPMLEHIILRAKNQGFKKFSISINYLGNIIEDYFEEGQNLGVEISYLKEEQSLGTAGSLSLLDSSLKDSIIVTNGDVITDINYSDLMNFHIKHSASATMAVQLYDMQNPYGVVEMNGVNIIGFHEKPITRSYINAGVYAVLPSSLSLLEYGEACDMPSLFTRIQKQNKKILAYPMHEQWLDVGRPEDLTKANHKSISDFQET
jgi:dTDP-glucose pyrophosphorylase